MNILYPQAIFLVSISFHLVVGGSLVLHFQHHQGLKSVRRRGAFCKAYKFFENHRSKTNPSRDILEKVAVAALLTPASGDCQSSLQFSSLSMVVWSTAAGAALRARPAVVFYDRWQHCRYCQLCIDSWQRWQPDCSAAAGRHSEQ